MPQNKSIQLQYYASLREQTGCSEEEVTTVAKTAADLYDELADQHDFNQAKSSLRVAINDEFCDWETELESDDRLVFIPPVSGG